MPLTTGDPTSSGRGGGAEGAPLRRAVSVLETLAGAPRPLSLTELTDRLGLPKSSLHRMMGVLTGLGLARRTESRHYATGDRLAGLARSRDPDPAGGDRAGEGLLAAVTPYLLDLVRQTGQVASVATLRGTVVHHRCVLHDHDHARVAGEVRKPSPAHRSAPGKLLLAAVAGPATLLSTGLREELELVRRTGLAHARTATGLVEIAAPIRLGRPAPVAALVLTGSPGLLDVRGAGRVLLRAATGVEEGYGPAASG